MRPTEAPFVETFSPCPTFGGGSLLSLLHGVRFSTPSWPFVVLRGPSWISFFVFSWIPFVSLRGSPSVDIFFPLASFFVALHGPLSSLFQPLGIPARINLYFPPAPTLLADPLEPCSNADLGPSSELRGRYRVDIASLLDERQRRLFAGLESLKCGWGGDRRILLGSTRPLRRARSTSTACGAWAAGARQRKKNAGIEALMAHETAGDPV